MCIQRKTGARRKGARDGDAGRPAVVTRREWARRMAAGLAAFPGLWPLRAAGAGIFQGRRKEGNVKLPEPTIDGAVSLEQAIKRRRTERSFSEEALTAAQLSQLLWAAQGVTEDGGVKRAAPSGGALYPMDVYAVIGDGCVETLSEGVYHYEPEGHALTRGVKTDRRNQLAAAALGQTWMARAPVNLVITAEYARICSKYGDRGVRYAMIEAGHVGQNIFLQAEALGLSAGIVGAFRDREVIECLRIPGAHEPLLIMPVGRARS